MFACPYVCLAPRPITKASVAKVDQDTFSRGATQDVAIVEVTVMYSVFSQPAKSLSKASVQPHVILQSRQILINMHSGFAERYHRRILQRRASPAVTTDLPISEVDIGMLNGVDNVTDWIRQEWHETLGRETF